MFGEQTIPAQNDSVVKHVDLHVKHSESFSQSLPIHQDFQPRQRPWLDQRQLNRVRVANQQWRQCVH